MKGPTNKAKSITGFTIIQSLLTSRLTEFTGKWSSGSKQAGPFAVEKGMWCANLCAYDSPIRAHTLPMCLKALPICAHTLTMC